MPKLINGQQNAFLVSYDQKDGKFNLVRTQRAGVFSKQKKKILDCLPKEENKKVSIIRNNTQPFIGRNGNLI